MQEALDLQPDAVEQGCLLAQLYMMRGQPEDALGIATALREAAPQSADAHGLFILLKEAEGVDLNSSGATATAYLSLLHCDPAASSAIQGVHLLHLLTDVAVNIHVWCCQLYCPRTALLGTMWQPLTCMQHQYFLLAGCLCTMSALCLCDPGASYVCLWGSEKEQLHLIQSRAC